MEQQQAHQHILLRALVDELAGLGLRDACTSPGSRSTPIVVPLVRHGGIRTWSHVDERSAGFFALGAAKAGGRPVLVTCTSGTAAANLAPAVHEAREAGVPLLVVTADRPAELREVGAGQVIDQVKLFGSAAKWSFEAELAGADAGWTRRLAARAWLTATRGRPGVVHLNVPLRDPLVPPDDLPAAPPPPSPVRLDRGTGPAAAERVWERPCRGAVVAGTGAPPTTARWAERAGWPLLADPLSGARTGRAAVAHYDLLLRGEMPRPEAVLRVGDLPTSKSLRTWLASLDGIEQVVVPGPATWPDPMSTATTVSDVLPDAPPRASADWLAGWREADERAARALDEVLGDELSEPAAARALTAQLPPEATLYVASSMPVRDVEAFAPVRDDGGPRVLANRGANGIDGTISSAYGAAAVSDGPVVLLVGDVALAHDLGGLLAARRHPGLELTIVVLDNGGGGIFAFLPIAEERDLFEEHIATPTGLDSEDVARLFGLPHTRATTLAELRDAARRPGLVEVRSDRAANVALHRRLADAVLAGSTA